MRIYTSSLLTSCAICTLTSLALTTPSSTAAAESPTTLPPVIVSATRTATPSNEIGSSVTLITSDDIAARQANTLAQILQTVPGLNLVQTGNVGSSAAVYIRGTNSNHTKVLIDGIEASDPTSPNGAFDFSHILASQIDRIEVLRGPQSGLYGSDAIGGVINVITKQGKGTPTFTGSLEAGSFDTFNQSAGVSGSQGGLNYALDASHFYSGNMKVTPTYLIPPATPRNPDTYDNQSLSVKLGAALSNTLDVGLVTRYVTTALHTTTDSYFTNQPEPIPSRSDNNELFTRATAHLRSFEGKLEQTLGLAYTDYRRRYDDPNPATANRELYAGDRVKLDWLGSLALTKGETLSLGAESQRDATGGISPYKAHIDNNAAFIQLHSSLGDRLFNTISLRDDDNSRFGNKVTYRIAPAYLLKETDTTFKASLGTGFKAPTLDELYHSYPAFSFYANPNLQPESSTGWDVGFEQPLLHNRVTFGSTYFHNAIKDLITSNSSFTSLINIGRATTYGFETFATYSPLQTLTLRADHTFTIATDETNSRRLARRPKHKASLSADWQATDALSLNASVLFVGSWIDSDRDATVTRLSSSSYTIANVAAEYALTESVALFGRINNLFNRHYQNPVGFDQMGIGAFAGIKAHY